SRYAEACVALDTGEAWCGAYRSSYYKCSDYPEYDGELRLQGARETVWCRVRHEPQPIVSVSADGCLLEADSKLFCWLYDSIGYPVGDQAIKAFTGLEHRCVVTMHGDVGCWGDGTYGQLGYMGEYWSTEPDGDSPSEEGFRHPQVPKHFLRLPSAAKTIEVKVNSTCALLENGQIWCWGKFELPLASTRSIENYEERLLTMRDDSGSFYKQIGESTLPNSPIELPPGCKAQAFS